MQGIPERSSMQPGISINRTGPLSRPAPPPRTSPTTRVGAPGGAVVTSSPPPRAHETTAKVTSATANFVRTLPQLQAGKSSPPRIPDRVLPTQTNALNPAMVQKRMQPSPPQSSARAQPPVQKTIGNSTPPMQARPQPNAQRRMQPSPPQSNSTPQPPAQKTIGNSTPPLRGILKSPNSPRKAKNSVKFADDPPKATVQKKPASSNSARPPVIVGRLTPDASYALLSGKAVGTFVVRQSTTQAGNISFDFIGRDGKINTIQKKWEKGELSEFAFKELEAHSPGIQFKPLESPPSQAPTAQLGSPRPAPNSTKPAAIERPPQQPIAGPSIMLANLKSADILKLLTGKAPGTFIARATTLENKMSLGNTIILDFVTPLSNVKTIEVKWEKDQNGKPKPLNELVFPALEKSMPGLKYVPLDLSQASTAPRMGPSVPPKPGQTPPPGRPAGASSAGKAPPTALSKEPPITKNTQAQNFSLLQNSTPGTFIVRSSSNGVGFTIDYVNQQGELRSHRLAKGLGITPGMCGAEVELAGLELNLQLHSFL